MGQKVSPVGYRLGVSKTWESIWYAEKNFVDYLIEDHQIRKYIEKNYAKAMVSKIEISRFPQLVNVVVHAARPGIIIGKKGSEIEQITKSLNSMVKKSTVKGQVNKSDKKISVSVKEIKSPEVDSSVVGQDIARQIERRINYKRAIKMAIRNAMKVGAKGIKIRISGRLNGNEIARSEEFKEGRVPLSTLSANIDYRITEAHTDMGVIGIKVWIYNETRRR